MGVSVTRVVKFIRKGEKGDDAVLYKLITSVSQVSVADGNNGSKEPTPASVSCRLVKQVGSDTPVTVANPATAGLSITYSIILSTMVSAPENYTGAVPIIVARTPRAIEFYLHRGSQLIDTATVGIIYDGQDGEPGQDGQDGNDAISIKISPQNMLLKRDGKPRMDIKIYVDLFKGETRIPYGDATNGNMSCSILSNDSVGLVADGLLWSYGTDANGRFYYSFMYAGTTDVNTEIPFTITYNGKTYPEKIVVNTVADGADGEKGDRGPALRGPQAWSDCATGYPFQSGADGEDFIDVVLYGNNYYFCKTSHNKTDDNYPQSPASENNNYWQLGTKIVLIAAKILLAEYELVKNLGVECIDMKDAAGNIIFQAKDGNVTCRTGTFENIHISGKSTFAGLVYKEKTVITEANWQEYFIKRASSATSYEIILEKAGNWVDIEYTPSSDYGGKNVYLFLPVIRYNTHNYTENELDSVRKFLGNTISIYNHSAGNIFVDIGGQTANLATGECGIFTCTMQKDDDGYEYIKWECPMLNIKDKLTDNRTD